MPNLIQKGMSRVQEFLTRDNVRLVVRDSSGRARMQFNPNFVGQAILNLARRLCPQPYDGKGHTVDHIRRGIMPHLAVYGLTVAVICGSWLPYAEFKNGVTDAGRAAISSRVNGSGAAAAFTSIGMGTSTTAFNASQTALVTGVGAGGSGDSGVHVLPTAQVTVSIQTTTITNDTARLLGTVSISGTIAVTESGVFNADTNGTMLARQTFSAVNVVSGDSLQFQWDIKNA